MKDEAGRRLTRMRGAGGHYDNLGKSNHFYLVFFLNKILFISYSMIPGICLCETN